MEKIIHFLNRLEIWLFYVFLITCTLSVRKVLFFYPIRGQFNEYTGAYLYLSDVLFLLMLISAGFTILYNKYILKSSINTNTAAYLKQKTIIIPLFLVAISFASLFWSTSWQIALFRSTKLLEFYLLYLWVIFRLFHVEQYDTKKCSTWNIFKVITGVAVVTGIVQSVVGIWQFIAQKSAGLVWLKESIISPDISGVAKIVFDGEKHIRVYGLFPHPNILGGFLVLTIILTFAYFKPINFLINLINPKNKPKNEENATLEENVPPRYECSTWNILRGKRETLSEIGIAKYDNERCSTLIQMFHVEHFMGQAWNKLVFRLVLMIQFVALFLTFSKSAWAGLVVGLTYLFFNNVPRGTIWHSRVKKLFHVEQFKYFALLGAILFLLIFTMKPDWYSVVGKGIEDRIFYINVSRGTFLENPILGVGMGQSIYSLTNISRIQDWQFQPVHNVFLLVLSELGILGLSLFMWFVWVILKNVPSAQQCSTWNIVRDKRGTFLTGNYFKVVLVGFLFIMFFDHYLWDIQQGQIMLWLVLGVISGVNMWTSTKSDTYPQDKVE